MSRASKNRVLLACVVSVCLIELPATRPLQTAGGKLGGTWLTTLVFDGRRPIRAAISFENFSATSYDEPGQGRWKRIGIDDFSVEFLLSGELESGPNLQYRVTATLKLDRELGRLRGPVSGDVLDASGKIVGTLQGTAKAVRLSAP